MYSQYATRLPSFQDETTSLAPLYEIASTCVHVHVWLSALRDTCPLLFVIFEQNLTIFPNLASHSPAKSGLTIASSPLGVRESSREQPRIPASSRYRASPRTVGRVPYLRHGPNRARRNSDDDPFHLEALCCCLQTSAPLRNTCLSQHSGMFPVSCKKERILTLPHHRHLLNKRNGPFLSDTVYSYTAAGT